LICTDTEYSYMGAVIRVVVESPSKEICNEVEEASSKGYEGVVDLFKRHGGCKIVSELPLKILSSDENIIVVLEPINFIAKAFWGEAVKKIKSMC